MCRTLHRNRSSINSQHVADEEAAAADFEIPGVDNRELALWIKSILEFDQLILEFYKDMVNLQGWIHCSHIQLITIEINGIKSYERRR